MQVPRMVLRAQNGGGSPLARRCDSSVHRLIRPLLLSSPQPDRVCASGARRTSFARASFPTPSAGHALHELHQHGQSSLFRDYRTRQTSARNLPAAPSSDAACCYTKPHDHQDHPFECLCTFARTSLSLTCLNNASSLITYTTTRLKLSIRSRSRTLVNRILARVPTRWAKLQQR
jgi:hypothetical protein